MTEDLLCGALHIFNFRTGFCAFALLLLANSFNWATNCVRNKRGHNKKYKNYRNKTGRGFSFFSCVIRGVYLAAVGVGDIL